MYEQPWLQESEIKGKEVIQYGVTRGISEALTVIPALEHASARLQK